MSSTTKPPTTSSTSKPPGGAHPDWRWRFAGKRALDSARTSWATVAYRHVKLQKIKAFGFYHLLARTRAGVPKEYVRWGYVQLNAGDFYRVSVLTVRELQQLVGEHYCLLERKEVLTAQGTYKLLTAIDWHMRLRFPPAALTTPLPDHA